MGAMKRLILITLIALALGLTVKARAERGREFCPDSHTCYWAEQRQTGMRSCHVQNANLGQGWTWTNERCGVRPSPSPTMRPSDPKPKPTATPDAHQSHTRNKKKPTSTIITQPARRGIFTFYLPVVIETKQLTSPYPGPMQ